MQKFRFGRSEQVLFAQMGKLFMEMSQAPEDESDDPANKEKEEESKMTEDGSLHRQIESKTSKATDRVSDGVAPGQKENDVLSPRQKEDKSKMSEATGSMSDGSVPTQRQKEAATGRRKEEVPHAITNQESAATDIIQEACKYKYKLKTLIK